MKKKFVADMLLNIVAAGIPLATLQLIVYPMVSRTIDADSYGLMIALYSLLILINDPLGRSINNVRLIFFKSENTENGDYNVVLAIYAALGIIAMIIGCSYYYSTNEANVSAGLELLFMVITGVLFLIDSYIIVYFRIRLNYKAIAINAVYMSIGFLIGFWIFTLTEEWVFIYLFGHLFCFSYLIRKTAILREPFQKTDNFRKVLRNTNRVSVSLFLIQGMSQADKLLLFPLMGGTMVSVYYTATLAGKIMSLATTPINGVVLSYLSNRDNLSKKQFRSYFRICVIVCAFVAGIILLISRPVLGFLFPQFVDDAMKIVPYTTLNIFLSVTAGMLAPVIMKYCDLKWQVRINGFGFGSYVILSIVMLKLFGLTGFCLGIGISNLIRLIFMLLVYKYRGSNN